MSRIRAGGRRHQQVRAGAPGLRSPTANAGQTVATQLCDRLGVSKRWIRRSARSSSGTQATAPGSSATGIAAAQLAGEAFLVGLDRQRADAARQQITPVPGLASTTAAGLARRFTPEQWQAVEVRRR